jgi:dipeptidyl aminopeptidase/acylaminoacyl peptidase
MIRFVFLLLIFFAALSCSDDPKPAQFLPADTLSPPKKDTITFTAIHSDTTLIISGVEVDILIPKEYKADLLVLPGWNYSRRNAFGAGPLTKILLDKGYRLIMPEMGKSIYATNYFPETRKDWMKYPTLTWLTDTMMPLLQNEYGILREGDRNFIAGISTGARGVVLVAARNPVFTAGAALSGDYDQTLITNDNLMRGVYGEYSEFKERWESIDNPAKQVDKINMPLYLGHGANDKVVPVGQAKHYYEALHTAQPSLEVILHIDENAGHDPVYWFSEMDNISSFFDRH